MRPNADWSTRDLGDELGEVLRAELTSWPGVVVRPMMGTVAFYRGKRILGCYVNRELIRKTPRPNWVNRPGEPPLVWVRLRPEDKERALRRPPVCEARIGAKAWVEIPLASRRMLEEAVRWFGCAYESRFKLVRRRKSPARKKNGERGAPRMEQHLKRDERPPRPARKTRRRG